MADYGFEICYHPGKVNIVAYALSRRDQTTISYMLTTQKEMLQDLERLGIEAYKSNVSLNTLTVQSTLIDWVKGLQEQDEYLRTIKQKVVKSGHLDFTLRKDILLYKDHLCVPDRPEIKKEVMTEAHSTVYMAHPGSTKMYQDLKRNFW